MHKLYRAISRLNEIEKGIILLYLEKKNYAEIGEITGLTEKNISVKIVRIKSKLKKILILSVFYLFAYLIVYGLSRLTLRAYDRQLKTALVNLEENALRDTRAELAKHKKYKNHLGYNNYHLTCWNHNSTSIQLILNMHPMKIN